MQRLIFILIVFIIASPAFGADLKPDQQAAICAARASCKVTVTDAGQGAQHEALTVVEAKFALADKPKDAPDEGCINDSGDADAPDHDGGHEFWLIAGDAAPKRLLALCNDGYGAAGVGTDDVKIGPNTLVHEENGGSAWRWDSTEQIRLSPLQVVHELVCTFNDGLPGTAQVTEIDRLHLHARSVGYVASAKFGDDDGVDCPDWPTGPDSTLPTGPKLAGAYAVPMPNGGSSGDEQEAAYPDGIALGDCALQLSTDGLHGFLVFGKPAEASNAATLRVIQENDAALLIQVYDPTAAAELKSGKAKSWIGQPHIEIWTSEMEDPEDNDGANGQLWSFHQFAIGLDDKTYPGVKAFSPLPKVTHWAAKDETGRDVTVYRVSFDEAHMPAFGLGVVYSQAENGKQARLVSNVQIQKNKPLYLPETWRNMAEDSGIPSGTCTIGADKVLKLTDAE
ncbi:MAG TPA: hypothetical protein VHE77_14220 [Dongiaceae bacterium]|jgi:hypothetical protein|nr:hypothetical protein [Dongiaceae bacterium]